jgi:hypothetical protein
MLRMSQQFEDDKIHYTENAGRVFLDSIITAAEAYFMAELIDLGEDMEGKTTTASYVPTPINSRTFKSGEQPTMESGDDKTSDRIVALEREVGRMKNDMRKRQFNDSLMTARIREELDVIANKKGG